MRQTDDNNEETTPSDTGQGRAFRPWLFWSGIIAVCLVVIAVSLESQRLLKQRQVRMTPLPRMHSVHEGLEGTERNGAKVNVDALHGKVRVFAYIYTVCPHGCAAVIGEMMKLNNKFGQHPDFHQVSISVVPERDTPAMLDAYAQGIGLKPDAAWWFLTGEQAPLWRFMTNTLKLEVAVPIPEEERLNPLDLYSHDLRVVLVDRAGMVRGYYSVFHPQAEIADLMCERLQADVSRLLADPQL